MAMRDVDDCQRQEWRFLIRNPKGHRNHPKVRIASRIRCSMNHADFWVIPMPFAISYEETPFLSLAIIHIAHSHLSRPSGLSSKMDPTLTEYCFLQSRHFHISRVVRNECRLEWQRGHSGPSCQRIRAMKDTQTAGSEKCLIASISVAGTCISSMDQQYRESLGESSNVLPSFSHNILTAAGAIRPCGI